MGSNKQPTDPAVPGFTAAQAAQDVKMTTAQSIIDQATKLALLHKFKTGSKSQKAFARNIVMSLYVEEIVHNTVRTDGKQVALQVSVGEDASDYIDALKHVTPRKDDCVVTFHARRAFDKFYRRNIPADFGAIGLGEQHAEWLKTIDAD